MSQHCLRPTKNFGTVLKITGEQGIFLILRLELFILSSILTPVLQLLLLLALLACPLLSILVLWIAFLSEGSKGFMASEWPRRDPAG